MTTLFEFGERPVIRKLANSCKRMKAPVRSLGYGTGDVRARRCSGMGSWALALVLCAAWGCQRAQAESPEDAYRAFLRAIQKDEDTTAFATLSTPSRQALEVRAHAASDASGGAIPADAAKLLSGYARPAPVTEIRTMQEDHTHVTLEVTAGGEKSQVKMVQERQGWRIDVSQALSGAVVPVVP